MYGRFRALTFCFVLLMSGGPANAEPDTDELHGKAYRSMVREFAGLRGSFFLKNGLVSDQVGMALGYDNRLVGLPGGNYFFSGCRPHECDSKSAVVMRPDGLVLAAGLISAPKGCLFTGKPPGDCILTRMLTIYVKARNNKPELLRPFYDWARSLSAGSDDRKVTIFEKVIVPERKQAPTRARR